MTKSIDESKRSMATSVLVVSVTALIGFCAALLQWHVASHQRRAPFSFPITVAYPNGGSSFLSHLSSSSSSSFWSVALVLPLSFITIVALRSYLRADPLSVLPKVDRLSFLFGNEAVRETETWSGEALYTATKELQTNVFLWPAPAGEYSVVIGDPHALNHILHDIVAFPSTVFRREFVRFIIGGGIIVANPHDHVRQRRVMGPAFTQPHIRRLAPIFNAKANELGEKMAQLARLGDQEGWSLPESGEEEKKVGSIINVSELVDSASFDIIGQAGFGMDFDCLKNGLHNVDLASGYQKMLQASVTFSLTRIILLIFSSFTKPSWLSLPVVEANRIVQAQNRALQRLTEKVIAEKTERVRAQMQADSGSGTNDVVDEEGKTMDLVELMVRANARYEQKGQHNLTLSSKELQESIQVLLFAGYETSAVAASFTMHFLAQHQPILQRVREAIAGVVKKKSQEVADEHVDLTADELQGEELQLLTNCIKETLRLTPAVVASDRQAAKDCIIPLSRPIPTRDGKEMLSELHVPKGTVLDASFLLANIDGTTWGKEPLRWDPDRWNNLPEPYKMSGMPGPAGLMTFSSGPSNCLGARFAMLEIAALLVGVLRKVHLEPVKGYTIRSKQVIVARPVVQERAMVAMPLRVTPLATPF